MDSILRNTKALQVCSLEQQELKAEVLTIAVGVGVEPRAAVLTAWPSKLGSAETVPGGVAAPRQRPHRAAAAHCNTQTLPSAGGMAQSSWQNCPFPGALRQVLGAALSVQTVSLCPWHKFSHKTTFQTFSPPARGLWLCVPTQTHKGQTLTLAQRVVEVAWSTLVTRVPFKSCPAQTLPCLAVTGAIVLTRARALAGCKVTRALVNKQVFCL